MRTLHLVAAFAMTCLLLLVASCGGDETATPGPPTATASAAPSASAVPTETATATQPATPSASPTVPPAAESRWLELLAQVPATDQTRKFVLANDYEAAREAYGVELPATSGAREVRDYVVQLLGPGRNGGLSPSDLSGMASRIDPEGWLLELGFTPVNVDADILAGAPPDQMVALLGRFETAAVEAAVSTDPGWSDLLERKTYEGVPYYRWGEDLKIDVKRVSATRRLGESIRVAVDASGFRWAKTTAGLESMLDAAAGRAESLADIGSFAAMAAALDAEGLYTVFMSEDVEQFAATAGVCEPACLLPYEAFTTATGHDATGEFAVVVLVHTDEATARENAGRLEARIDRGSSSVTDRPWTDYFSAREIRVNGTVLVATLRTERPRSVFDLVFTRDNLLMHE